MLHYNKLILLIIIAIASYTGTFGQDSLSYYLEQAVLNNPGVKARYLEYSAALEKVPQAASLPDPQFQLGYFIKPMELLGGNQVANISLMQMFPWFGTLKAAKDEASKMAVAKFESFRDAKNELYFNVRASYYKVYRTIKEIEIAKKNLSILHSLEQLALAKFRSGGKDDMVDLLRVQIEIHELENRISLLKDQLTTDKVSFNRFLNRSASSEVFTGNSLLEAPIPSDILTLTDSLVNHPMVKMYQAESEANAAKLDMVTRMGYPMVGLGLNYMIIQKRDGNTAMMNGKDMTMPMVSLTLPIYRKKYKAMRHEAELMRDAATMSAENTTNDLRVSFQQTLQSLYDADRRVKLYTDQAKLADKSVQLLIASFSASSADFVEVLRMQQQLLDYQFKQVEAVVDKNTSIARVVYLTGNY
jgi:cobalt-zinc-cadmium efflux system outer membrane protein